MEAVVYHGSGKTGLTTIVPRLGSHGKAYVYATPYRAIGLLFLCRWNDFLITLDAALEGGALRIALTERYEGAFRAIYADQSGYLYTLSDAHFFRDPSCWEFECVSEQEETPHSCEEVRDVWNEIEKLCNEGVMTLNRYPNRPAHIPADDADMVEKAAELYRLSGDLHQAAYCAQRFPKLTDALSARFFREFGIKVP